MQSLQAAATASVLSSGAGSPPSLASGASRAVDLVRDVDAKASLPPEGRRMLLDLATQLESEREEAERLRLRLARSARELEEARAGTATLKDALAIRAKDFGFLSDNAVEGMRLLNLMQASLSRERADHAAAKEEVASLNQRLSACKDTLKDVLETLQASMRKIRDLNGQLDRWELVARRCEEVAGEKLTVGLFDKLKYVFDFYVDVSWELGIQVSFQQDSLPQVKARSVALLRELKTRLSHAEQLATTLKAEKEDLEVVNADLVETVANQEDILASTLAMGQAGAASVAASAAASAAVSAAPPAAAPAASGAVSALGPAEAPEPPAAQVDFEGIEKLVTENIELKETVQALQAALDRLRREKQQQGATIERLNSTNGTYRAKLDELLRDNVLLSTEIRRSATLQSRVGEEEGGPAAGAPAVASSGENSDIPAPRRSQADGASPPGPAPASPGPARPGPSTPAAPPAPADPSDQDSIAYMSLTGSVVNTKREAQTRQHAASVGKSGILDLLEEQEAALRGDASRQEDQALRNSQRVAGDAAPAPERPAAVAPRPAVPEDFFQVPAAAPGTDLAASREAEGLLLSLSGDEQSGEPAIRPGEPSIPMEPEPDGAAAGEAPEAGSAPAPAPAAPCDPDPEDPGSGVASRARGVLQRLLDLGMEVPVEFLTLAEG